MPCALSSLNHGDCFMLENPATRSLWVWHGEKANMREKMRVVEAANAFKEGTGTKVRAMGAQCRGRGIQGGRVRG